MRINRLEIISIFRHLNASAVEIQRRWRGYIGRNFFRIRIRNLVMIMRMNFYNAKVVVIQKRWRGYYVRKYVHNYYARKRYLEALTIKNQIVKSELEELKEQLDVEERRRKQEKLEEELQYVARKNHYLLSTHQIRGIYNSPFRKSPHEMELRLREARPLDRGSRKPPKEFDTCGVVDDSPLPIKPHPPKDPLPPIDRKRLQGPFKPPNVVLKQRYKPLNPSLRVSTDFESLVVARDQMKRKEWTQRIQNLPFLPFSRKSVSYQPLLHSQSEYHDRDFPDKLFCIRKEEPQKHVTTDRMRTVVSPIPIFEKFGETYSKGSVVLQ